MKPGTPYQFEQFGSYIKYLEDPKHQFKIDDYKHVLAHKWRPFERDIVDFGFSPSKFWVQLPIKNIDDHREGHWVLDLNSRFMNGLDAFLVTEDEMRPIVHDSEAKPFSERTIPYRQVAAEFSLAPSEKAFLVISYWSRGTTVLPFAVETQVSFYKQWLDENVWIVAFYSAMSFMILFGLAQFFILRKSVQLAYAFYVATGCLYIFHMDGLTFKYFWPDLPKWNADASTLIGLNLGVFSIVFARAFLNTKRVMPRFDRVLLGLMAIALVWMLASLFFDLRHFKQYIFYLVPTNIFFCLLSGLIAYSCGQREARFFILGWIGLFLSAAFAAASHLIEKLLPIPLTFDFAKAGIFIDGLMFAMAMADQANEVRKQRDRARQREEELLQHDLETQKQINLLENQYQSAMQVAQQKSYALASAGHDLRQPIVALKSAMDQVTQRDDVKLETINQFRQGFDYIEKLITLYLDLPPEVKDNKNPDPKNFTFDVDHSEYHGHRKTAVEIFPVNIVLDNVNAMFLSDAEKKGIELRCINCSAKIKAHPVSIMRLVSNLVENAIKYTISGKVLLGARRRADGVEIQVIDTGVGFSKIQQETYFDAYERDEKSTQEGQGLGLSIVKRIADENDYLLVLESRVGLGSVFKILIPKPGFSEEV